MSADPTLKPDPSDNEYQSFAKIVDILNQMVPSQNIAPANIDPATGSLQKINALLWEMLDAPWIDCVMQNGWTGPLQARVNMSRIEFSGTISSSTALGITPTTVATLPSTIVPSTDRNVMAPGGAASNPACLVGILVRGNDQVNAAAFNNNDSPTHVWMDGVSVPL